MNSLQITMNKNIIKDNQAEIAKLKEELKNTRIRNIAGRQHQIDNLEYQIKQCLMLLLEAGEIQV